MKLRNVGFASILTLYSLLTFADESKNNKQYGEVDVKSCVSEKYRKFIHVKQAHYVPELSEDLKTKVSAIQKNIYGFANHVLKNYPDEIEFFDEGYAHRTSLDEIIRNKVLKEYSLDFRNLFAEYNLIRDLDDEESISEQINLETKIEQFRNSGEFENHYYKNPFLFGALSYMFLKEGLIVLPTEDFNLNQLATRVLNSKNTPEIEKKLIVWNLREDTALMMIDRYSDIGSDVLINFGSSHDFSDNIEKYNQEKSKDSEKFCLINFYPYGIFNL